MWWQIGLVADGVVALAYLAIALAIVQPLVEHGHLRSNPLGAATAAVFLTCAIHDGGHCVRILLPLVGVEHVQGIALRTSYDWEAAIWDLVTAAVGVYYWTLRRRYAPLTHGAQLFEDLRRREKQALELNDNVLQGLVVAKMALELNQPDQARTALESSIGSASRMISDLLGAQRASGHGGLLRSKAATLDNQDRLGPGDPSAP